MHNQITNTMYLHSKPGERAQQQAIVPISRSSPSTFNVGLPDSGKDLLSIIKTINLDNNR